LSVGCADKVTAWPVARTVAACPSNGWCTVSTPSIGIALAERCFGSHAESRCPGGDRGHPQGRVGFPPPIGTLQQQVAVAPCEVDGRRPGRAQLPAAQRQAHAVVDRIGANPQFDFIRPVGDQNVARDGDPQPLRQPREHGDLRHRKGLADRATCPHVDVVEPRSGIDQAAIAIDEAVNRRQSGIDRAHRRFSSSAIAARKSGWRRSGASAPRASSGLIAAIASS
jgi:hypothetical protein